MKYCWPFLLIFTLCHSFAQEGGHTGNGGGVVKCSGQPAILLDLFEEQSSKHDYLDLDSMRRSDFIMKIIERLGQAEETSYNNILQHFFETSQLAERYNKITEMMGPLKKWPTVKPLRLHDEALASPLPSGCEFQQAAYSNVQGNHFYFRQIPEVVQSLTSGQQLVLELHEALQVIQHSHGFYGVTISSIPIREFVRVLIRKKITKKELFFAYYRFLNPLLTISFSGKTYKVIGSNENHPLYQASGAYRLTQGDKECAALIGLGPVNNKDFLLYQFSQNDEVAAIKKTYLPEGKSTAFYFEYRARQKEMNLIEKREGTQISCTYLMTQVVSPKERLSPFMDKHPLYRATYYVKKLIGHFSNLEMGLKNTEEIEFKPI